MTKITGISALVILMLVAIATMAGAYIMTRPPYSSPTCATVFYRGTLMHWCTSDHMHKAVVLLSGCGDTPESKGIAGEVLSASLMPEGYGVIEVYGRLDGKAVGMEDVRNAVDYLRSSKEVDKVGLIGLGCGGYLVLMAAAKINASFVIDAYGFTDLYTLNSTLGYSGKLWEGVAESLLTECAEENISEITCLVNGSPVGVAGSIKMPILILHGKLDNVVPVSQSVLLYQALRRSGNNCTELITYDGLGFGFPITEGRVLEDLLSFLRSLKD